MHASLLAPHDLTAGQLERWEALASATAEPNPFFEPRFVLAAAPLFGDTTSLLVIEDGQRWAACMPIFRRRGWHRLPLGCVANWGNLYCFLGTPLVRAESAEDAVDALISAALELPGTALVGFDLLGAGGRVHEALTAALDRGRRAQATYRAFERAALYRRPDGEYTPMRPKRRRELERQRRRLAEQLGDELATVDRAGDPDAVEEFMRIEAAGWKGRAGTALASDPEHAAVFHRICETFDADGRLQLLALSAGQRTVAMKCNLRAGEGLFCFKIAFDETLARFSPGIQLELDNVDLFDRDERLEWMDSCAEPGNEMINRLWPQRRPIISLAITASGTSGLAARAGVNAARRLRGALGRDS